MVHSPYSPANLLKLQKKESKILDLNIRLNDLEESKKELLIENAKLKIQLKEKEM